MNTQQETYKVLFIPYKILFEKRKELDVYIDTNKGNSSGAGVQYVMNEEAFNAIKKILKKI
jgi:hypothetical protein